MNCTLKNGTKNPETVVVSGFFEPISFSVRNVGCGGGTFFSRAQQSPGLLLPRLRHHRCLTLGVRFKLRLNHTTFGFLTNASRLLARLRCPKRALLALARRISTAALAFASLFPPLKKDFVRENRLCRFSGTRCTKSKKQKHKPCPALGNATQRATLVGLITQVDAQFSLITIRKGHPRGCPFLMVAGAGLEPHDLRVMSPTSYQLLHPAIYPVRFRLLQYTHFRSECQPLFERNFRHSARFLCITDSDFSAPRHNRSLRAV